MTIATLLLLAPAGLVGVTTALVRTVRRDGLGHRPPPRSHHDWTESVNRTR